MSLPIKEFLGQSHLFDIGIINLPDNVEYSLFYRYSLLMNELEGKNERSSIVLKLLTKGLATEGSAEAHNDLMQALLYGILVSKDDFAEV